MAFSFSYGLDSELTHVVKDLAVDTSGNYGGTYKKGDLVYIDGTTGLVRKTVALSTAGISAGVLENGEFTGLANGGTYAATNASNVASVTDTTRYPNGMVKVRLDKAAVYKVKSSAQATNANIGKSYAIAVDGTTGDQTVNLALTTNAQVKVIDFTSDGYVYVTIN